MSSLRNGMIVAADPANIQNISGTVDAVRASGMSPFGSQTLLFQQTSSSQLQQENELLRQQLQFMNAAGREQIHQEKLHAAQRCANALERYKTEYNSAVQEVRRQSQLEVEAEKNQLQGMSDATRSEAIASYTSAEHATQRAHSEMLSLQSSEQHAYQMQSDATQQLQVVTNTLEQLQQDKHTADLHAIQIERDATTMVSQLQSQLQMAQTQMSSESSKYNLEIQKKDQERVQADAEWRKRVEEQEQKMLLMQSQLDRLLSAVPPQPTPTSQMQKEFDIGSSDISSPAFLDTSSVNDGTVDAVQNMTENNVNLHGTHKSPNMFCTVTKSASEKAEARRDISYDIRYI